MKIPPIFKAFILLLPFIPSHDYEEKNEIKPNQEIKISPYRIIEIRSNAFHETIIEKLKELGKESKFFQLTLDAVNKKGYEFILYSKEDKSIPEEVHELLESDAYHAMTFKDTKKVYIKDSDSLGALVNEAVHIVEDPTETIEEASEVFGRDVESDDVKEETILFKEGKETRSEKIFHDVLNEEILSQVVEDIIVEKSNDEEYKFKDEDLKKGEYSLRLLQIKSQLGIPVFIRVFDVTQFKEEEYDLILKKVNKYLHSGEIEKYLTHKLSEYGLLD